MKPPHSRFILIRDSFGEDGTIGKNRLQPIGSPRYFVDMITGFN